MVAASAVAEKSYLALSRRCRFCLTFAKWRVVCAVRHESLHGLLNRESVRDSDVILDLVSAHWNYAGHVDQRCPQEDISRQVLTAGAHGQVLLLCQLLARSRGFLGLHCRRGVGFGLTGRCVVCSMRDTGWFVVWIFEQ